MPRAADAPGDAATGDAATGDAARGDAARARGAARSLEVLIPKSQFGTYQNNLN